MVTASELPLVVRFLSQQLPASLKLHGETLALLHGIDATSHGPALGDDLVMNTAGIATLHAADAAGAVNLHEVSAAVSRRHYPGTDAGTERPGHLQLSFFATDIAAATDLFAVILADLQPPPRSLMFAGLNRQFLPAARAQFGGGALGLRTDGAETPTEEPNDTSHWVSPCVLLWRPPPGTRADHGLVDAPTLDIPVPTGCALGPLVAADSYLVNDTWAYGKTEATRVQRVLPCIEHQLSVGLRLEETGELVAWAIGDHPYGAIGKVFTVEAHRRKGYSAVVCAALTKLVEADAQGERPRCAAPFCFVVADNVSSLSLFRHRLGYVEAEGSGQLDWVGF